MKLPRIENTKTIKQQAQAEHEFPDIWPVAIKITATPGQTPKVRVDWVPYDYDNQVFGLRNKGGTFSIPNLFVEAEKMAEDGDDSLLQATNMLLQSCDNWIKWKARKEAEEAEKEKEV